MLPSSPIYYYRQRSECAKSRRSRLERIDDLQSESLQGLHTTRIHNIMYILHTNGVNELYIDLV